MKEIIEKLSHSFQELGLDVENIGNLELLLKLTKEDIEKRTDLSYQVTPILEQLLKLSRIYVYLDDDEENELLMMNQTDFFSKIHNIIRLSEQLLDEFRTQGIIHPILASDFEFGDVLDSQEECVSVLEEISQVLGKIEETKEEEFDMEPSKSKKNPLVAKILAYTDRVVGYYQVMFYRQVVPELRDDMFEENYGYALEVLSNYIDLKLKLLSGMDDDNSIYLTDLALYLHELLDNWLVEDIYNRIEIEGEEFDSDNLEDEEYFQLLILMFENRYHRQKSCRYYYHDKLTETEVYKEKCKKL